MKLEIKVPNSLNDITLGDYQIFNNWLNQNEKASAIVKAQKMVEIFCRLDLKDIINIAVKDCFEIYDKLNNILNTTPETFATTFNLCNINFGLIPDFDKMTIGEYANIDEYLASIDTYHKAFAVLYRPIVTQKSKKYTIQPYTDTEATAEIMKNLSLDVILGTLVFFWNLNKEYQKYTILSSLKNAELMEVMQKNNLLKNTDGTPLSMQLAEDALDTLTNPPRLTFTKL